MLNLFNPFELFGSAIRGAAGGIARDLEPEEHDHHEAAAPPPPPPPAAPAPPLKTIRRPIRPVVLAAKPKHSTAFYVAVGATAAVVVGGVGWAVLGRRG